MTTTYDYQRLLNKVLADTNRARISDRDMSVRCGTTERKVRKARLEGMDEWTADVMCVRAGYHPKEVYDDWVTPESLFAAEIREGKIRVEDVPGLVRDRAWLN